MKILIVDDDELGRQLDLLLIRVANHEHREACSGEQALQVLEAWRPEVILMDLNMPGMGGLACIRKIRANPELAGIVIAVLSFVAEDFGAAMAAGANLVVGKPQNGRQMLALLQDLEGLT